MQKPYLWRNTFSATSPDIVKQPFRTTLMAKRKIRLTAVMHKLVYAVTGNNSYNIDSTFKRTSKYRECQIPGSNIL